MKKIIFVGGFVRLCSRRLLRSRKGKKNLLRTIRMEKQKMRQKKLLPLPVPGVYLKELLESWGVTNYCLAKMSGIPQRTIELIIAGKRKITPEIALRIGAVWGISARFWMNSQMGYEQLSARRVIAKELKKIKARSAWVREKNAFEFSRQNQPKISESGERIKLATPGDMLMEALGDKDIFWKTLLWKAKISRWLFDAITSNKRKISKKMSRKIGLTLGMSPDYWLGVQKSYDARVAKYSNGSEDAGTAVLASPGRHLGIYLEDYGLTKSCLAKLAGISPVAIGRIVSGTGKITGEMALRIGAVFGMSARFWTDLQNDYDERAARSKLAKELAVIEARSAWLRERIEKWWNEHNKQNINF